MRQNLEEFFRNLLKHRISRKKFLKAGILSLLFASKGENKRENVLRPYIDAQLCIGCGICQTKCPVRPMRAIKILLTKADRI